MFIDNQSLRPGTVIRGPQLSYTVIRKLGQGGFGITYLVEAPVKIGNIEVPVRFALKEHFIGSLCSRDSATQSVTFSAPVAVEISNSMRSFIKEATRLQELDFTHHNIVKINEVFEANNTAYYVMEFLEGESLADYIKREGPLSFEQASYFLRPVAEAIAELHARHLTHYDIKPANIILTRGRDGKQWAVLIDFGLSKHYDHDGHATSTVASGGYSPGYSPVEQYAGIKKFTPQADVYALAATLWHCLKGEAPAESVLGPVNTIDTDLADVASPQLIEAMRHAMANFSDQRTPDAGAFVREVFDGAAVDAQPSVTGHSTMNSAPPTPPPGRPTERINIDASLAPSKSRGWVKWAIIGAAALIGIILAVILVLPGKEKTPEPENEVILTAADDEIEEAATQEVGEVEPVSVETKSVDTVVAVPRTEVPVETANKSTIVWKKEEPAPKVYGRTSYNNFDLATIYDGEPRFFSIDEWNAVPDSEKGKYNKKGVVVKGGSVPAGNDDVFRIRPNPTAGYASDFIVDLKDKRWIAWEEAIKTYGKQLPDVYQAYFLAKNYEQINQAIKAFVSDVYTDCHYWSRTSCEASFAWYIGMDTGIVHNAAKQSDLRVRLVSPIPEASAK